MNKVSIGLRLSLAFGLLIVLLLILAGIGLFQMSRINDHLREITQVNTPEKEAALVMRIALDARAIAARDIVLAGDDAQKRNEAKSRLATQRGKFVEAHDKLLGLLKQFNGTPRELEVLNGIKESNARAAQYVDRLVTTADAGKFEEAAKQALEVRAVFGEMRNLIEALSKIEDELNAEAMQAAAAAYGSARTQMIVIAVVSLILASLSALVVTRSLTTPINTALNAIERIAQGDLTTQVKISGSDEIARLAQGVSTMNDALRTAIGQVRDSTDQVSSTSEALNSAAQQVNTGSEEQSAAASAMAAALEEMSTSINHVSSLSDDARNLSQTASAGASAGAHQIAEMLKEIERIARTIEESANSARELGHESERISTIVSVIKDVADQTNLLALNAAIEAARAGETGRGFAVVADEVRKLAERTTASAQEITEMVHTIQGRSQAMTRAMEGTVTQMQNGMSMAQNAGSSVQEIDAGAKQVTAVIDDVATALKEQSSASHELANRVEQIVQMIEENTSAVGAVANSASDLNGLAQGLRTAVGHFKTT